MAREKKGVAIGYSEEKRVPEILAQARGMLLEKLLLIARENDITIYKDSDLTEALSTLKVGSEIPENMFKAIAEVLAYCYNINEKFKKKIDRT